MKRPDVSLAQGRLNADDAPQAGGDATGNAQRVPLAKVAVSYTAHLAHSGKLL